MKEKLTNTALVLWNKIPTRFKDLLTRFYINKKIFWLVIVAFSFIFLILIMGLLFGKRGIGVGPTNKTPTSTPQIQTTSQPVINDQFSQIEQKLNELKNQIINLNVKQSRLASPTVNFNVKF